MPTIPVLNETAHPAEFIVSEANGRRSRDVVTVAAAADLPPGTVVGRITASGKVVRLAPAADNGSEDAYGVLLYPAAAASADDKVTAIVRDAELNGTMLAWPAGISGPDKAAAIAALEARGLIVR